MPSINPPPKPGDTITLQVAVTEPDAAPWPAGSYAVSAQLRSGEGAVIAEVAPVPADAAANPGPTSGFSFLVDRVTVESP